MNKLFKLILFFVIVITTAGKGFTQNINFQFRDSAALVNTFIDIPLRTNTTLTGRGIVSYSLQFAFNAPYLSFEGVVTTGAIAAGLGTPTVNTAVPGVIKIAGAGATPLSGVGTFLFLRFKILQAGGTSISATGGADQNYFNEGDPVMVFQNSCLLNGIALPNIAVSPNTAILLKGETQQFTASGGAAPYTWSTANAAVSGISAAGLLTANQIGFTTVQAIDANGYIGQSNSVEIRGYRLSIPDTTGPYNTEIKMPVRVTSLAGLNVVSGSFTISFNVAAFTNIQIDVAGTLLETAATPVINLNTPGIIQVSFAGATILSGSGILFYIRGKLSNPAGSSTSFTFQNALLNEDLQPIIKNGSLSYGAPPAISLSPNSGQLVYGDSLLLTVNGVNATAPFVFTVSDTNLATVGANRYLKVKRSGQISISVTDANSATATTGIFQLYDTYLKISDTTALPGAVVDLPITIKALPADQSVFSIQGKIFTTNPSLFTLTDIVTTGTPMASFSVSSVLGSNYILFAIAGVTAVPGNTVLFKVKTNVNPLATVGSVATLSFQDILINEGIPLPLLQIGTITVAVPVTYRFTGNGNWNISSNWISNVIPPAILQGADEIIIDPVVNGECILNIDQRLLLGTKLTLIAGKKLRILSNLIVK